MRPASKGSLAAEKNCREGKISSPSRDVSGGAPPDYFIDPPRGSFHTYNKLKTHLPSSRTANIYETVEYASSRPAETRTRSFAIFP